VNFEFISPTGNRIIKLCDTVMEIDFMDCIVSPGPYRFLHNVTQNFRSRIGVLSWARYTPNRGT